MMENPKRASGWPDVARWQAIHDGAMAGEGGLGGEPQKQATDHGKINGEHRRGEEVEANLLRLITVAEKARRRLGGVELPTADLRLRS